MKWILFYAFMTAGGPTIMGTQAFDDQPACEAAVDALRDNRVANKGFCVPSAIEDGVPSPAAKAPSQPSTAKAPTPKK